MTLAETLMPDVEELDKFFSENNLPNLRRGYKWVLDKTVQIVRERDGHVIFDNFWTRVRDNDGIKLTYFTQIVEAVEEENYFEWLREQHVLKK